MKGIFFTEREFENRTGLASNMLAFAIQNVQAGETPVFNTACQNRENHNVYTATYDIMDKSNTILYELTVTFDLKSGRYSFKKSRNL